VPKIIKMVHLWRSYSSNYGLAFYRTTMCS